jgi:hypothetical protein
MIYIDKYGIEMDKSEWQELAADARYCRVADAASADGRITVTTGWVGKHYEVFRIVVLKDGAHKYSETTFELKHAVSAHTRIVRRFIGIAGEVQS